MSDTPEAKVPDPDLTNPDDIASTVQAAIDAADAQANAEDAERLEATDNGPRHEDGDQPDQPAPAGEDGEA